MNAAASAGEDTRMSRDTPIFFAFRYATKPRPICFATSASISAGYRPRTSYALKIDVLICIGSVFRSGPAVVGQGGLVAEDGAGGQRHVTPDMAVAADDRAADGSVLADPAVRPHHRAIHHCVLLDLRLPADDGVGG